MDIPIDDRVWFPGHQSLSSQFGTQSDRKLCSNKKGGMGYLPDAFHAVFQKPIYHYAISCIFPCTTLCSSKEVSPTDKRNYGLYDNHRPNSFVKSLPLSLYMPNLVCDKRIFASFTPNFMVCFLYSLINHFCY